MDCKALADPHPPTPSPLLASLGVEADPSDDITQLTYVRSRQEIKAAEEIAQRTPCPDFKQFKPIFKQVQQELASGVRQTLKYQDNAAVNQGDLFILDGQVVYDNGTESNLLLRSLQRALNKDKVSRRITTPDLGPLFSDTAAEDDLPTGYICVLRSQSNDPYIAEHRSVIHKIGVTGGDVKKRIANAKKDPTYLLAEVEIVATFKLANINRKGLEALLHKFFDSARLDVGLQDRFGIPVKPKEWFLLPLGAIEDAIEKIKAETLAQFRYDPESAKLVRS